MERSATHLARPHEAALGLERLCHHVVDQPVVVLDALRLELGLVLLRVHLIEHVLWHFPVFAGSERAPLVC
jgi:hypothetical protein